MSTLTVKAVWPGQRVSDLLELGNARSGAPRIWRVMNERYVGAKEGAVYFQSAEFWPLYRSAAPIPRHHRAALLMTYPGALIHQRDFVQAADDLRGFMGDFPTSGGDHLGYIATALETADCPAVGFHWSSLDADPFAPPDWGKFWNVYDELAQVLDELASAPA